MIIFNLQLALLFEYCPIQRIKSKPLTSSLAKPSVNQAPDIQSNLFESETALLQKAKFGIKFPLGTSKIIAKLCQEAKSRKLQEASLCGHFPLPASSQKTIESSARKIITLRDSWFIGVIKVVEPQGLTASLCPVLPNWQNSLWLLQASNTNVCSDVAITIH